LEPHLRLQILSLYPVFQSLEGAIQNQSSHPIYQTNKYANPFPVDCVAIVSRAYIFQLSIHVYMLSD
jgi:hypothetical protein